MAKKRLLVLGAFAVGVDCLYAAQEKQKVTLEGTLVSASCYLGDHSATGNDMGGIKACGSGCLFMRHPASVDSKPLTAKLGLLDATYKKTRARGAARRTST